MAKPRPRRTRPMKSTRQSQPETNWWDSHTGTAAATGRASARDTTAQVPRLMCLRRRENCPARFRPVCSGVMEKAARGIGSAFTPETDTFSWWWQDCATTPDTRAKSTARAGRRWAAPRQDASCGTPRGFRVPKPSIRATQRTSTHVNARQRRISPSAGSPGRSSNCTLLMLVNRLWSVNCRTIRFCASNSKN